MTEAALAAPPVVRRWREDPWQEGWAFTVEEEAGQALASCLLKKLEAGSGHAYSLEEVFTKRSARRRGLARAVCSAALAHAQGEGATVVRVTAVPFQGEGVTLEQVVALYESVGLGVDSQTSERAELSWRP